MKNSVFWDDMPRGSCESRRVGGTSVLTRIGELGTALAACFGC
jgi:hypothetical protein